MDTSRPARRRSPFWMRQTSSTALHGIAGRFARDRQQADLTAAQEWLWDAVISELEYRRRLARPTWSACSCQFCIPPFPDVEGAEEPF